MKNKYTFEITRMELVDDGYGNKNILVKQVKVMDEDGKYIKFAKLNDALLEALKTNGFVMVKK